MHIAGKAVQGGMTGAPGLALPGFGGPDHGCGATQFASGESGTGP
jgi:hypothetical protein